MTITIQLSPEVERRVREKAALSGLTVEGYLGRLTEEDAAGGGSAGGPVGAAPASGGRPGGEFPKYISHPDPTPEEARRLLDEMAAMGTGRALPPDFSRADLYDDHD